MHSDYVIELTTVSIVLPMMQTHMSNHAYLVGTVPHIVVRVSSRKFSLGGKLIG